MGFANQIKVTAKLLNCRLQPSASAQVIGLLKMDEIHNIVAEINGWGQLEDGSWINLSFTVPHERKETVEIPQVFVTGMSVVEETVPVAEVDLKEETTISAEEIDKEADVQSTTIADNKPAIHKVKKKESLWDIAEFWYGEGQGDRYIEIKEFNNLKSDILRTGMILKIPGV